MFSLRRFKFFEAVRCGLWEFLLNAPFKNAGLNPFAQHRSLFTLKAKYGDLLSYVIFYLYNHFCLVQ